MTEKISNKRVEFMSVTFASAGNPRNNPKTIEIDYSIAYDHAIMGECHDYGGHITINPSDPEHNRWVELAVAVYFLARSACENDMHEEDSRIRDTGP